MRTTAFSSLLLATAVPSLMLVPALMSSACSSGSAGAGGLGASDSSGAGAPSLPAASEQPAVAVPGETSAANPVGGSGDPSENAPSAAGGSSVPSEILIVEPQPAATAPSDGPVSEATACEAVSSQAQVTHRPMDIVLVIDNSGSMGEEIEAVERNINDNFAQILEGSGIDYRVVMVTGYRTPETSDNRVCIGAPLGPSECADRPTSEAPHNADKFVHFDQPVGSEDAFCVMLQSLAQAPVDSGEQGRRLREPTRRDDPRSQAGWSALLRPEAFKAFIMIGDDTMNCETDDLELNNAPEQLASDFDAALRGAAPDVFGALDGERKYAWHSIVGVAPNDGQTVYEASEPMVEQACETAENEGAPHQEMSRLTGGLRYPVCSFDNYDAVFQRIATEIVDGAALPCLWTIPTPPDGQTLDKDKVNLAYVPGDGSIAPELSRVADQAACGTSFAWYYDDPTSPTTVHACPAICEQFAADDSGRVDLLFGCATKVGTVK